MTATYEAILTQLGYNVTRSLLDQLKRVEQNTARFALIARHIIALNDALKPYDSFVALSSSHDFFKIKNQALGEMSAKADEIIAHWADKYKIELEKVAGKKTFYIKGYAKV